jgi:branched-chain amino acid transport system ATP-binding protein
LLATVEFKQQGRDISFDVEREEIVWLLGANGAGKATILQAISGLLVPGAGRIALGGGNDIGGSPAEKIVRQGIIHVPEGRQIFPGLTVIEHLELGAYCNYLDRSSRDVFESAVAQVFELFAVLRVRQEQLGETFGSGEQQILAVGRAQCLSRDFFC